MLRSLSWQALTAGALGLTLLMTGCASMSLDQKAPIPSSTPQLTRGRIIYVTNCAKCHAPEPIHKYSAARWETIIPDMLEETHLSPEDATAVTAYVRWALAHPPVVAQR